MDGDLETGRLLDENEIHSEPITFQQAVLQHIFQLSKLSITVDGNNIKQFESGVLFLEAMLMPMLPKTYFPRVEEFKKALEIIPDHGLTVKGRDGKYYEPWRRRSRVLIAIFGQLMYALNSIGMLPTRLRSFIEHA